MKNIFLISILSILIFSCRWNNQTVELIQEDVNNEIPKEDLLIIEEEKIEEAETKPLDSTGIALTKLMSEFKEFEGYEIYSENENYHIKGDFFGDETEDIAILVNKDEETKIAFIDYGTESKIKFLGIGKDSIGISDYAWAEVFNSVKKLDTLWSNYVDGFRDIHEVPLNEKIVLNYNAIYVHMLEACGGGFIFWKDNKWNWLQQE